MVSSYFQLPLSDYSGFSPRNIKNGIYQEAESLSLLSHVKHLPFGHFKIICLYVTNSSVKFSTYPAGVCIEGVVGGPDGYLQPVSFRGLSV